MSLVTQYESAFCFSKCSNVLVFKSLLLGFLRFCWFIGDRFVLGVSDMNSAENFGGEVHSKSSNPREDDLDHFSSLKWSKLQVQAFSPVARSTWTTISCRVEILLCVVSIAIRNACRSGVTTVELPKRVPQNNEARDALHRLRTLFGFGWFLEWEGGRHPLNSTWPWSNVKPSILVLWGVCWMFVLAASNQSYRGAYHAGQGPNSQHQLNWQRSLEGQSKDLEQFIKREPYSDYRAIYHPPVSRCDCTNTQMARQPRVNATTYHHPYQAGAQQVKHVAGRRHESRPIQAEISMRNPIMSDVSTDVLRGYLHDQDLKGSELDVGIARAAYQATLTLPPQTSGFHIPFSYDLTSTSIKALNPHNPGYYASFDNTNISRLQNNMSLYEGQPFPDYPVTMMHDPIQDQDDNISNQHRYPSPPIPAVLDESATASLQARIQAAPMNEVASLHARIQAATATMANLASGGPLIDSEGEELVPYRKDYKQRPTVRIENGYYNCTFEGCTEEVKGFKRKCEWAKHMDKHERPYRCPQDGCEKLPGFTYSGGLLRHQREVHNLWGGPRKQLNCPHPNCKRFSGKGFSRQENLNEHLRRVHTNDAGEPLATGIVNAPNTNGTSNPNSNGVSEETEDEDTSRGVKRKRGLENEDSSADIRQEMARLRTENQELKKQSQNMMEQIQQLQSLVGGPLQQLQQAELQQRLQQVQGHGSQQQQQQQAPQAPMM